VSKEGEVTEIKILLWIHSFATPLLDKIFLFSNLFGLFPVCAVVVTAIVLWHLFRREWREALAWVVIGTATLAVPEIIKRLVARPRPELWETLVHASGYSFPSGHAVASATFYPLLGWDVFRRRRAASRRAFTAGALFAIYVGVGRLYLGVHWPTDVVAGWLLGFTQSGLVIAWLTRHWTDRAARA
jgi:membrane-associated phospholipid phosphatase